MAVGQSWSLKALLPLSLKERASSFEDIEVVCCNGRPVRCDAGVSCNERIRQK